MCSPMGIDYLAERKDQPEPFFLYLAHDAPHVPFSPGRLVAARHRPRAWISMENAPASSLIERLDDGIGKVMQALADNGQTTPRW